MKPVRRPSLAKLKKERAAQQALFIKQAEEATQRMQRQDQKTKDVDGNGPVHQLNVGIH